MPLRPIDAIFVHPTRRLYVVYYRGELWQLPRMKIDDTSWQRRQPYTGDLNSLYLSSHQAISDPVLAQKLRTLNLPAAVRGSTLPRFEAWWETHGFAWLKEQLTTGQSPLAAHIAKTAGKLPDSIQKKPPTAYNDIQRTEQANHKQASDTQKSHAQTSATTDVFAEMLADLADEVLHQQR